MNQRRGSLKSFGSPGSANPMLGERLQHLRHSKGVDSHEH